MKTMLDGYRLVYFIHLIINTVLTILCQEEFENENVKETLEVLLESDDYKSSQRLHFHFSGNFLFS